VSETEGSRGRILDAARELFVRQGFHATAVREIAERVGLTKTAVLYHYPAKLDLAAALAEPLLAAMEQAMADAAAAAPERRARAAVEGMLDAMLGHRELLGLLMRDSAFLAERTVFARFAGVLKKANALVAGPSPDLAALVRASQVIAVLADPIAMYSDASPVLLRAEILRGVDRLITTG
jgi:AcrR family transcriptional regulator